MCPAVPTITLLAEVPTVPRSSKTSMLLDTRIGGQMVCRSLKTERKTPRAFLLGGGDFVDDGLRCAAGIRGGENRTSDDEEVGAGANGFGGRGGAGLIVVRALRRAFFF